MNELRNESEAVLAAAVGAFADVPGVEVIDDADGRRSIAPGRPWPFLNAIARVRLADETFEQHVATLELPYRRADLPVIWSMTAQSRPVDLDDRLARLGHTKGDWDATMMIAIDPWPEAVQRALDDAATASIRLETIEHRDVLDEWIEVMATSYGWSDPGRTQAMREVYDPASPHGRSGKRTHLLARIGGEAVGSGSLFEAAGQGWVTNIGTIPGARGRGVGAAITSAVLESARKRGFTRAWLGASEMGAPVYERLGFATAGLMMHRLGPAPDR